jgi:hypothetical protein
MSGNHPREFKKRSQLIISVDDETVSVVAMRVSNPDGSPAGVHRIADLELEVARTNKFAFPA